MMPESSSNSAATNRTPSVAPAGDGLQFRPLAPVDDDVADLAGVVVEAVEQLAVEDQRPADARPGEDAQDVPRPARRPVLPLAERADAHIVLDERRPGPDGR